MSELLQNNEYRNWLTILKSQIKHSQIKAALAVNSQLIQLYWELGKGIVEKQENAAWGSGFIEQLSKDLKSEFPDISGFSAKNLRYCKSFFEYYNSSPIWQQVVAKLQSTENQNTNDPYNPLSQIPWGHHILIIQKIKDVNEAYFYIKQTIENNWSRAVLEMQIESNLYERQGKAISNFKNTLPDIESDLANALLKDPYNFDFLTFGKQIKERDLEQKLIENISHFLLELGKGFAYMGRQFVVNVGGREFKTDLLFYHTKLKCYIIIELKVTEFEPEYLGKLNFYVTAINTLVKDETDKATIGILLCKTKNNVVVDFALRDINKPLGVSEFTYTQLPQEIQQALPTVEQLTAQLMNDDGINSIEIL